MAEIVPFPTPGARIALYTETRMFVGTLERKEPSPEYVGLWLKDAIVLPITGRAPADQVLRLDGVCVLWDRVIAFGDAPQLPQLGIDG